jgi:hypothetical protein
LYSESGRRYTTSNTCGFIKEIRIVKILFPKNVILGFKNNYRHSTAIPKKDAVTSCPNPEFKCNEILKSKN